MANHLLVWRQRQTRQSARPLFVRLVTSVKRICWNKKILTRTPFYVHNGVILVAKRNQRTFLKIAKS